MCEGFNETDFYNPHNSPGQTPLLEQMFIECPDCKGKGEKYYMERIYEDAYPPGANNQKFRVLRACKTCYGKKVLPTEEIKRLIELFGFFYEKERRGNHG